MNKKIVEVPEDTTGKTLLKMLDKSPLQKLSKLPQIVSVFHIQNKAL